MAESQMHMDLVTRAYKCVETIVSPNTYGLIQCDSPKTKRPTKVINGYIPDIYYWNKDLLIIGEAKTIKDFDNKHSKAQIESYYLECVKFYGKAVLVVAVPWQLVISVKNYIRNLKRKHQGSVNVVVINELGWEEKL